MSRILAIANQKGGVGKTTTTINLAASLAASKKSVLLIDMDPQGNATMGSGVDKYEVEFSAYDVLVDGKPASECILTLAGMGVDILPGNADVTAAEVELIGLENRESRLRDALKPLQDKYEYILVDCPPSLNMLTLNSLVAANGVIIPMQCEYYALEGLAALTETIESVRNSVNPGLQIEGLLRTMFDPRNNLSNDVSDQLLEHFGDRVYRTIVPRNVRLAEAPSHGLPVIQYDKTSRGAVAYLSLAGEIVRRQMQEASVA